MYPVKPNEGETWGIMGGIFDPIHYGHLILAQSAFQSLGLKGVLFIPAFNPPHRPQMPQASFDDRLRMVNLSLEGNNLFSISDLEKDLKSPGYTLAIVDFLHLNYPGVRWILILGADNIAQFDHWHKPEELIKRVKIAVGDRPGYEDIIADSRWAMQIEKIFMPQIEISSTMIREMIKAGRSIRYLVPEDVRQFIEAKGLYR
jgi:nicotinate-nucleotide adenylyltransferase